MENIYDMLQRLKSKLDHIESADNEYFQARAQEAQDILTELRCAVGYILGSREDIDLYSQPEPRALAQLILNSVNRFQYETKRRVLEVSGIETEAGLGAGKEFNVGVRVAPAVPACRVCGNKLEYRAYGKSSKSASGTVRSAYCTSPACSFFRIMVATPTSDEPEWGGIGAMPNNQD